MLETVCAIGFDAHNMRIVCGRITFLSLILCVSLHF